jgi:hypothetical protein
MFVTLFSSAGYTSQTEERQRVDAAGGVNRGGACVCAETEGRTRAEGREVERGDQASCGGLLR